MIIDAMSPIQDQQANQQFFHENQQSLNSKFFKVVQTASPSKGKQAPIDQLNDWNFCNPDNFDDPLPQPFKFIDSCLNKMILRPVYQSIFEIEKQKNNPNYDGHLKEGAPSGTFDIDGITFLTSDPNNSLNQMIGGDKSGNLYIFDLSKKIQICKIQVVQNKRINHISSVTTKYPDGHFTTISVIARGDPIVYIYRFKTNENKAYHNFTVLPKNACRSQQLIQQDSLSGKSEENKQHLNSYSQDTDVSEFPFESNLSKDSCFLSVTYYNGSVDIFSIPKPPLQQQIQNASPHSRQGSQEQDCQKQYLTHKDNEEGVGAGDSAKSGSGSNIKGTPQQKYQMKGGHSLFELAEPAQIESVFYHIDAKFPLKKLSYDAVLSKYIKKGKEEEVIQQPGGATLAQGQQQQKQAILTSKDVKKNVPLAKGQKPAAQQVVVEDLAKIEELNPFMSNVKQTLGKYVLNQVNQDISATILPPTFYPKIYFTSQQYVIPNEVLAFNKVTNINVTTGLIAVWIGNTVFDTHVLQSCNHETAPLHLIKNKTMQDSCNNSLKDDGSASLHSSKGEGLSSEPPKVMTTFQSENIQPKLIKINNTLYYISCSEMSYSEINLALGLIDGTVMLWNCQLDCEKSYLDKHLKSCHCIKFLSDRRLISGGEDGSVHVYDLQKNELIMKRTNQYNSQQKYRILQISVSDAGIAIVLDSKGFIRMYDIIHGEKILKVVPSLQMENVKKYWVLNPFPIICGQNEQFCVVSQYQKSEQQPQMTSQIQIYKTFDNLINIYQGLSNLYRKGTNKEKILNAFCLLKMEDLNNASYDMNVLTNQLLQQQNQQIVMSAQQQKSGNKRNSMSYPDPMNRTESHSVMESSVDMNSSFNTKAKNTSTIIQKMGDSQFGGTAMGGYTKSSKQQSPMKRSQYSKDLDQKSVAVNLTKQNKELLSPEKFLAHKEKVVQDQLFSTQQSTLLLTRERNVYKAGRSEKIGQQIVKIGSNLLVLDEKIKKEEKRHQMLSSSKVSKANTKRK